MRSSIFTILFIFTAILGHSQLLQTSGFTENLRMVNPAAVDFSYLKYRLNTSLGVRLQDQWSGFQDGDERQFSANVGGDFISKTTGFIWGGTLQYDQISALRYGDLKIRGSISLPLLSKTDYLSVGISLGGGLLWTAMDRLDLAGDLDPAILPLLGNNQSTFYPNAGVGLYYYHYENRGNVFFFGASLPNAVPNKIDFGSGSNLSVTTLQHMSFQGGFRRQLRSSTYFELDLWMKKATGTVMPAIWSGFGKLHFKDIFWAGIGGNFSIANRRDNMLVTSSSAGALAAFGVDIPNPKNKTLMQFGMSYYTQMGRLQRFKGMNSPEIFLRLGLIGS